jgi:glutathione peroxidase
MAGGVGLVKSLYEAIPLRLTAVTGLLGLALLGGMVSAHGSGTELPPDSLYRLTARTLDGQPADLRAYSGKVALVVNVASRCGYTPQYAGLERLYRELQPRGLVILGFPSNDFGGQEPGTAQEIKDFCSLTYQVTFPMFDKVVTRPGAGQSPVYANLQKQSGTPPRWNFSKYLVGRDGRVVRFYPSEVRPDDPGLRRDIETALGR